MDQLLTEKFWHSQWDYLMGAPWLLIPLLLLALFVGNLWRRSVAAGEIRALREQINAEGARLNLAREQYASLNAQLAELTAKAEKQQKEIAELKSTLTPPARFEHLVRSNTEIQNALTSLAASTSHLGQTLTFSGSPYRLSVEPIPEVTKRST
jgi:hypothetical protein